MMPLVFPSVLYYTILQLYSVLTAILLLLLQGNHQPKLNGGTVLKTNDNQRYATNGPTGFIVREIARRANVPVQVCSLQATLD